MILSTRDSIAPTVLIVWSAMARGRLTLGYRTALARVDSLLLGQGETVRGHEFHWSEVDAAAPPERAAYGFAERAGSREGYADGRLLASYLHVHFASRTGLAERFVGACAG